jgi:hypothetical protein
VRERERERESHRHVYMLMYIIWRFFFWFTRKVLVMDNTFNNEFDIKANFLFLFLSNFSRGFYFYGSQVKKDFLPPELETAIETYFNHISRVLSNEPHFIKSI